MTHYQWLGRLVALNSVPQSERDALTLAVCYAGALVATGRPDSAHQCLQAARDRVKQEYGPELSWRAELLAAYAEAETVMRARN